MRLFCCACYTFVMQKKTHSFLIGILLGAVVLGLLGVAASYFHKSLGQKAERGIRAANQATNQSLPLEKTIVAKNGTLSVRIARTQEQQELGLSFFESMPTDQGMLFPFAKPGMYGFWMKDMTFPLDIIWLRKIPGSSEEGGEAFRIVHVAPDLQPSSYPVQSFSPSEDADAVLEVDAGIAKQMGLEEGADVVSVPTVHNPSI